MSDQLDRVAQERMRDAGHMYTRGRQLVKYLVASRADRGGPQASRARIDEGQCHRREHAFGHDPLPFTEKIRQYALEVDLRRLRRVRDPRRVGPQPCHLAAAGDGLAAAHVRGIVRAARCPPRRRPPVGARELIGSPTAEEDQPKG